MPDIGIAPLFGAISWSGAAADQDKNQENEVVAKKKKQAWVVGSVFLLPLKDGESCLGQVIGREPGLLNCVAIALFDCKKAWAVGEDFPALSIELAFSAIYVTRDLLDSGRWAVIDDQGVGISEEMKPYEHLRDRGFIGAKVRGSANVEEFANAFYGLMSWDDWYVPDYLDAFLLSADKKPIERLVYSGRHPRPQ